MPRPTPGAPAPLSMEAIARTAGVAASTVSRALRGDPRISAATRARVQRLVDETGYRPNPLVSALMTQLRDGKPPAAKCNLAWLDFYPQPEELARDPVHRAFFAGATERARALGYAIDRIPAAGRTPDRLARVLRNRGIKGVLLPHFDGGEGIAANIPLPLGEFTLVGVGIRFEQPFLHYSSDDQYESSRLAVQQLWALGYRRIAYIGDPRIERIVNGRFFAGYYATIQTELKGKALPPLLTSRDRDAVAWLRANRAEAIVSANRNLYTVLRDHGLRLPQDVALAHLNVEDAEGLSGARPGEIAGVRQDNVGVGASAIELLVSLLYHNEQGVPLHPRGMQVQGTWVAGATVRPAP